MATHKEPKHKADAYRSNKTPHGLNHIDKGSPAKKISTAGMKSKDKQK